MAMLQTDEPMNDPQMTIGRLYYLGQPYAHEDSLVTLSRYQMGLAASTNLMIQGYHIYSPIVHNHPIICNGGPRPGWIGAFWRDYDLDVLSRCDGLVVLCLKGWDNSAGLAEEIKFAKESGMNIWYRNTEICAMQSIPPDTTRLPL